MGLLDMFNDPKQAGLMMAAAQMMAQSGPSARPVGIGEILGGGMQTYMGTKNAMSQQQADEEEREQQKQYRATQMQGMELEQSKVREALQRAKRVEMALKSARAPQAAAMGQMSAPAVQGAVMPTQSQPQDNPYQRHMAAADALRSAGLETEAMAYEDRALKFAPKVKNWQEVRVGNSVLMAPFFEDGTEGKPMTLEVARKLEFRDGGGTNDAYDPYTGQRKVSVGKTQSPDSVATATTAANRLKFDKEQAAAPIFNADAGVFVNRPTAQNLSGSVTPIEGFNRAGKVVAEQEAKRASASKALLPILDQAEKLIDGATGSYAGAGVDQLARVFGKSTDGAKVTAKLKVLEGQIMMSQPRMEGPQSNMDMQLYRQMAGQIGDPTTPIETRKAALQGIRAFHQKYAGQGGASGDWGQPGATPSIDALLDKYGR